MRWEERGGGHMGKVGGGEEGMEVRLERRRRTWDSENCEYSVIMMGLGTRSRKG